MASNSTNDSFGLANSTAFDWEPFYYADPPYRELQMVWLAACTVLGVCGNMALLITVSCVQELRTPGNALLCALAVADIFQLVTKVPMAVVFLHDGEPLACDGVFFIIDTVYLTMAQFSINIIAPISIDRYWYICSPLKYSDTMTSARIALLIGLSFLLAMVTMVHPLLEGGNNYFHPPYILCKYLGPARKSRQAMINVCILVPMITMVFCYYKIWGELKRRQKRHNKISPVTRKRIGYQISPEFRARMRSATMVLLIVAAYVVSWAPYFAAVIRSNALGDEVSTTTDGPWQRFAVLFSLLSTFSNPIIYAYRNPQLRNGFFRLVRRRML
ncbi:rhodopsin, GQ-coupled-like [Branchiostoma floridae x Branchiostoma japonicum]